VKDLDLVPRAVEEALHQIAEVSVVVHENDEARSSVLGFRFPGHETGAGHTNPWALGAARPPAVDFSGVS
jgi:hypothetical protein